MVVGERHAPALRGGELLIEEFVGELAYKQQAFAPLAVCYLFGRKLFFLNLDMVLLGKVTQSPGIIEMFVVHHEPHGRAGLAAAKALVDTLGRGHIKRRRLLVVERTASHQAGSAPFQGHEIAYDLFYAGRLKD